MTTNLTSPVHTRGSRLRTGGLASGQRANGLRIGTSMRDCRYASTRARHCVPATLVASIDASLTERSAASWSPRIHTSAIAAAFRTGNF